MENVQNGIIDLAFMLTAQSKGNFSQKDPFGTRSFCPSEIWNRFLQRILSCMKKYPQDVITFTTLIYNAPLWFDRESTKEEEKLFIDRVRKLNISDNAIEIVNIHLAATTDNVNIDTCSTESLLSSLYLCCYIKLCAVINMWKRLPYEEVKTDIILLNQFFKEIYSLKPEKVNSKLWLYTETLHPNFYLANLDEFGNDTEFLGSILKILIIILIKSSMLYQSETFLLTK